MSDAVGPAAVSVRFRLTRAEYQAATLRLCLDLWTYRGIAALTALALAAGVVFALSGSTTTGLTLIGMAIVWALTIGWAVFIRPGVRHSRQSRLRGEQVYAFSDDEIKASDPSAESRIKWTMYDKVIETRDLYLLRVTRLFASVVPKRAFASPGDEARFRELVRKHLKFSLS